MADTKTPKFLEVNVLSNGHIKFAFGNGQMIDFDSASCTPEIRKQAELHGFNQKIRDCTAGFSKESDFAGAIEAVNEVIGALHAGSWNRQASGGGTSTEDLIDAIAKVKKVDRERAEMAVRKASDEQKKAWAKNAQVAAELAAIKAARAKANAKAATADLEIDL